MKIIVKRKEWHRIIGGDLHEEETTHEFESIDTNCKWIDWGAAYEPKGKKIKGALPREINFSFKVTLVLLSPFKILVELAVFIISSILVIFLFVFLALLLLA